MGSESGRTALGRGVAAHQIGWVGWVDRPVEADEHSTAERLQTLPGGPREGSQCGCRAPAAEAAPAVGNDACGLEVLTRHRRTEEGARSQGAAQGVREVPTTASPCEPGKEAETEEVESSGVGEGCPHSRECGVAPPRPSRCLLRPRRSETSDDAAWLGSDATPALQQQRQFDRRARRTLRLTCGPWGRRCPPQRSYRPVHRRPRRRPHRCQLGVAIEIHANGASTVLHSSSTGRRNYKSAGSGLRRRALLEQLMVTHAAHRGLPRRCESRGGGGRRLG